LHHWLKRAAMIVAVLAGAGAAAAGPEPLRGRVVGVADGDTLTVLTPQNRQVKVRLDQIDAPERGQAYGARAKQSLSGMVHNREVRVEVSGKDRYGRTLGVVRAGDVNVNARLVATGAAWAYRDHLKDDRLLGLEQDARKARRGLWAQPSSQITAPWDYRAEARGDAPAAAQTRGACAKRTCSVMTSCAEARRALRQCRLPHLDKDGDGVPCESLCPG
jgi:endonuclease YncB( thermonuclease family)